jgi:ankyrin repeat protein
MSTQHDRCLLRAVTAASLICLTGTAVRGTTASGQQAAPAAKGRPQTAQPKRLVSLFDAVSAKDPANVTRLLKSGADVNARRSDGATALHIAVRSGVLGIVQNLLDHGADINASVGQRFGVMTFEEKGTITYHTAPPSAKGGTPLHWAAAYEQLEILEELIKRGAKLDVDDGYGNTPVHFAAESGNMKAIVMLVDAGASWKLPTKPSEYRVSATPLHVAKTIEIAEYFLGKGVAVDANSTTLGRPIHAAVFRGNKEVVDFLLQNGARIDGTCEWNVGSMNRVDATPLWVAAWAGNGEMLRFLEGKGGNVNFVGNTGGSLLHAASMAGRVAVIKQLLAEGLPVDTTANVPHALPMFRGWTNITPLGAAVIYGKLDAAKALVEAKADVNARFTQGREAWNPLEYAAVEKHRAMVAYLLQTGARLGPGVDIKTFNTSPEIKEMIRLQLKAK